MLTGICEGGFWGAKDFMAIKIRGNLGWVCACILLYIHGTGELNHIRMLLFKPLHRSEPYCIYNMYTISIPTNNVPSIYFTLKFAKLMNVIKSSHPGQQWAPTAVAVVTNPCWWRACFLPLECQWQNPLVTSVGVVLNPRGHLHKNNWPELVNMSYHVSSLCFFFCWGESFARPARGSSIVEVSRVMWSKALFRACICHETAAVAVQPGTE